MWGKILTRLFALFGMSLTCVACYGTMYDDYHPEFSATGRVVDEAGEPIPGIWASIGSQHSFSKDDGHFHVDGYDYSLLILSDVDGEDNGGEFKTKEIHLQAQGPNELGDVVLERIE